MHRRYLPLFLGLLHGVSDCTAGFLLGSLADEISYSEIGLMILVYNLLAFGGQWPIGVLLDKLRVTKIPVLISLGFSLSGLIVFQYSYLSGIILIGIGSGIFHVAAGGLTLMVSEFKASGPGIFAAPGVMGLAIGAWLAFIQFQMIWILVLLAIVFTIPVLLTNIEAIKGKAYQVEKNLKFELHDWIMIALLFAIGMRSAVWNVFQLISQGDMSLLIQVGVAAMLGEFFGGFLADRFGWRNYALGALLIATTLLSFFGHIRGSLLVGIAILQSTTGVAVAAMHQVLPNKPNLSAALALGLAIVLGGLTYLIRFDSMSQTILIILIGGLLSAAFYLYALRKLEDLK